MKRTETIALDFDGVIADSLIEKSDWLLEKHDISEFPYNINKTYFIKKYGSEIYQNMQKQHGFEDTLNVKPTSGCKEALNNISNYFSLVVVTARYNKKFQWAIKWLNKYKFDVIIDDVISCVDEPKISIVLGRKCKYFIDNDIRHFSKKSSSKITQIQYLHNGPVCHDKYFYKTARSWHDIEIIIDS